MNKPQILIIEDDNAIGNLISTTVETQHYQYRRAKNGASGVLEAASCRPDVILLDLGLQKRNSVSLLSLFQIIICQDHNRLLTVSLQLHSLITGLYKSVFISQISVSLRNLQIDIHIFRMIFQSLLIVKDRIVINSLFLIFLSLCQIALVFCRLLYCR